MIQRIDLRGADRTTVDYRAAVPRADFDVEAAVPAVHAICEAVRTRGLDAIREYGERFDGVVVDDIRVAPGATTEALEQLDPAIRAALEESIRRLRADLRQRARDTTPSPTSVRAPGSPTARCRSTGSVSTCPAGWPRWSPAC